MRRLFYATLIMMCVATTACSQNLTRATAKEIITRSLHFPTTDTRAILAKYVWGNGHYWQMSPPAIIDDSVRPEIMYLTSHFLMTESYVPGPGVGYNYIWLEFTDQSRPFMVKHSDPNQYNDYHTVKICDFIIDEITGIRTNGDTAVVEYTLRRTNWTPFGEYYRQVDPDKYPEVVEQSTELQKYDDGWRVKK